MEYDEIKKHFSKNDLIISLGDGKTYKYSGFLCQTGMAAFDSFNQDLVLYKDGKLATVVEKGINHERIALLQHIDNVRNTCSRLNCTPTELLRRDYKKELNP